MCSLILTQLNELKLREMDESLNIWLLEKYQKEKLVQAYQRSWSFGGHHLCEFIIKHVTVSLAALG